MLVRASILTFAIALIAGAARPCHAEPPTPEATASLEARLAELEEQIRLLRAELASKVDALAEDAERQRMEGASGARSVVPALGEGSNGFGPAASKVYGIDQGVSLGGYGEMLYEGFSSEKDDGSPATSKDRLDFARAILYTGFKFNDRILFNSELEVEHATTGEGDDEKGEVSLEQAYLDFRLNDHVGVRTGLMLMPMGFVNEIHEPNTFLGAGRPEVERRIIPSTWRETGAGLFGSAGPVSYRAYLVTGMNSAGFTASNGIRGGRQGGSRSLAEDLAFVARADVKPLDWLSLGASAYTGGADQDAKTPTGEDIDADVTLWEAHAEIRYKGLDIRALWATSDIDDVARINEAAGLVGDDSVGSRQEGWYASAGFDVLARRDTEQEVIPFTRYERFDTQAAVPDGFARDPANDRSIWTLGLSYKPHPQVVIKLDWQDVDNEAGTGTDRLNLGVGYAF